MNFNEMTDTFITMGIILSTVSGQSIITGIENQRVKECNRIKALCKNLQKLGVLCKEI